MFLCVFCRFEFYKQVVCCVSSLFSDWVLPLQKAFFQPESGCGFFLVFAKRIREKQEIFNLMFSFLKHSINFHSPFFLQQHQLYLHRLNSSERFQEIPLDVGAIMEDSGRREHTEMFYSFASFLVPSKIFRYGFTTNSSEVNICEFANVSSLELFLPLLETPRCSC